MKKVPDLRCEWDKEKGQAIIIGKDGKPLIEIKNLVDDSTTFLGSVTGARRGQDYIGEAIVVGANAPVPVDASVSRVSADQVSCSAPKLGFRNIPGAAP
jgi:hypothetical protein